MTPSFCSNALARPSFLAQPPVSTTSSTRPTFLTIEFSLPATELLTPAAISITSMPSFIRVTTSDSANTLHWLVMVAGFFDLSESDDMPSRPHSRTRAIASKNLPVPAAQRSFITNSRTLPFSSSDITLQSCPPISTTVRTEGRIHCAPRAWQVISEMFSLAKGTLSLP